MTQMIPVDMPAKTYSKIERLGMAMNMTSNFADGERVNVSAVIRLLLKMARSRGALFYLWVRDDYQEGPKGEVKSMSFQVDDEMYAWLEEDARQLKMTTLKVRGVEKPNIAAIVRAAVLFPFAKPEHFILWMVNGMAHGLGFDDNSHKVSCNISIEAVDKEE